MNVTLESVEGSGHRAPVAGWLAQPHVVRWWREPAERIEKAGFRRRRTFEDPGAGASWVMVVELA